VTGPDGAPISRQASRTPLPAPRGAAVLNLAKAWLLVAFLAALLGGLGWLIGGATTALLFAFCSLLAATGVYRYGDRALLGMLDARPFALAEDPLLRSAADTSAAKLGVRPPTLYLIPDGFPRLFAVGRGPTSSTLAVSAGAVQALRPEELEAAIAHELAHVRRRDVLVQTFVVLFAATLVEEQSGSSPTELDAVVVARPARPQQGETQDFLAGLYGGLASTSIPAVGVDARGTPRSPLAAFRRRGLSTVEAVDEASGRVALVFLLAGAPPGSYGIGSDATDGVLPDVPPAASSAGE